MVFGLPAESLYSLVPSDRIVFGGLGDPERATNSGHFGGIVHHACARTVPARRKVGDRHVGQDDTVRGILPALHRRRRLGSGWTRRVVGHVDVDLRPLPDRR